MSLMKHTCGKPAIGCLSNGLLLKCLIRTSAAWPQNAWVGAKHVVDKGPYHHENFNTWISPLKISLPS